MLVFVIAACAYSHIGGHAGLVRRLIPRKPRVPLDAEIMRLGLDHARIDVDQPVAQLLDEQLEWATPEAQKIGLMGFEPGATLFRLQLQKELDRLVRKPSEAFDRGGRGWHGAQCTPRARSAPR